MFNKRGNILFLTLIILTILSILIIEFSYKIYTSVNAFHNWEQGEKLSYIAQSGIRLGAKIIEENLILQNKIILSSEDYPQINKILKENLIIQLEDENAKFNLNKLISFSGSINEEIYKAFCCLLNQLNLPYQIADRLVDWIDLDHEPRIENSEKEAKNAPLDSIDELLIIPGISTEVYKKLLPYVTIYGNGLININTAPKPILMCLSEEITEDLARRIIEHRQINPFEKTADIIKVAGFERIGLSLIGKITVRSSVFCIRSIATIGGIKREITCILDYSHKPPIVKYWKEV